MDGNPTKVKKRATKKKTSIQPKAQRVVVDEIMDTGVARILRADHLPGYKASDMTIQSWSEEKEDFIEVWKIEAFVGLMAGRKLREGDVFFIKDGSLLNRNYRGKRIIKRAEARKKHLCLSVDDSIEQAKWEIKDETRKLAADKLATSTTEKNKLYKIISAQKQVMFDLDQKIKGI